MNNKEQLQNPWIEITPEMEVKVLEEDRKIVNSINAKYKKKKQCTNDLVCTIMWPEPFQGNPNAPVYLLNGNPGGDIQREPSDDESKKKYEDYKKILNDSLFSNLMIANLSHQSVSGYDDFLYNNKLVINNKVLDGSIWWEKGTEEIRNALNGKNPNLFVVEYFPYNSKKSIGIDRSKRLHSYAYSDYLIKKAMADEKLIVIMRWKTAWLNRIDGLATYPNLLEISSDRRVFLSSGNLLPFGTTPKKNRRTPENKRDAWNKLIMALK